MSHTDANIKTRELQSGYFSFDTFESIFIQACINLQQEKGQTPLDKKSRYGSIDGFDGAENTTLSQELRDTICLACPLPSRFAQAWDEWCYWNHLAEERRKTYPAYLHVTAVAARELLVVECLLTLPTNTLKEIVDWSVIAEKHSEIDRTSLLEEFRTRCLHFHTTSAPPPFSAKPATPYYRSRRDKQDEVRKALLARPHLSDRKIAAEIGVSPSTVGKIRKGL